MSFRALLPLSALALIGASLASAATAAVGADAPTADTSSPTSLFKSVCLADEVRLPADRFRAVSFKKLPAGAKAVMEWSLVRPVPGDKTRMAPIREADVPNRLLVLLPDEESILLLPAPTSEGRAAQHCAVIWRGNDYAEALDAVDEAFQVKDALALVPPQRGVPGMNFIKVQGGGRIASAAEFKGWTMIRAAPETSAVEQIVQ
jgi:hypothetical protein